MTSAGTMETWTDALRASHDRVLVAAETGRHRAALPDAAYSFARVLLDRHPPCGDRHGGLSHRSANGSNDQRHEYELKPESDSPPCPPVGTPRTVPPDPRAQSALRLLLACRSFGGSPARPNG